MMAPQLGKMAVTHHHHPALRARDGAWPTRCASSRSSSTCCATRSTRSAARTTGGSRSSSCWATPILLSIEDNGPGLADPDKLFEPFYTTKKPGEGLGLGLAISAGFAAELGGRLVARNAPDGGAVFELLLPRDRARPRQPRPRSEPE